MKIYDCFTFYNELDLLEIRLNELNDVVDKFVLVEAEKTHQNKNKILHFYENKNRFAKFLNKIIHVIVPKESFIEDAWYNENFQRKSILDGLKETTEEDILIVSDLDEIPSKKSIEEAIKNNKKIAVFEQLLHYYYLNTFLLVKNTPINYGSVLIKKSLFEKNTEIVRSREKHNLDKIKNGGWHFSFLGNENVVYNKIQNYAHTEFSHFDEETIKNRLHNLQDPLGRYNCSLQLNKNIDYLPKYVINNLDKFKKYIKD